MSECPRIEVVNFFFEVPGTHLLEPASKEVWGGRGILRSVACYAEQQGTSNTPRAHGLIVDITDSGAPMFPDSTRGDPGWATGAPISVQSGLVFSHLQTVSQGGVGLAGNGDGSMLEVSGLSTIIEDELQVERIEAFSEAIHGFKVDGWLRFLIEVIR